MFESFSRSWRLVRASYDVLKQDKELIWFPIVSMVGTIIASIMFIIPLAGTGLLESVAAEGGSEEVSGGMTVFGLVLAFIYYFVLYTIIIFSNTALIGAALMRLRGEDPTVRDGFRIASERIGKITGYAAIAATVGMILQAIRGDEDNIVGQIVGGILGIAWNIITFLVIPILVVENVGPIEAIKRSAALMRRTWGEQIAGNFSIGIISFLASLAVLIVVGAPLFLIASATNSGLVVGLAIAIIVLAIMAVNLFFSALGGIFQAALYNYATEGESGEFFPREMLEGAFRHR